MPLVLSVGGKTRKHILRDDTASVRSCPRVTPFMGSPGPSVGCSFSTPSLTLPGDASPPSNLPGLKGFLAGWPSGIPSYDIH